MRLCQVGNDNVFILMKGGNFQRRSPNCDIDLVVSRWPFMRCVLSHSENANRRPILTIARSSFLRDGTMVIGIIWTDSENMMSVIGFIVNFVYEKI